MERWIVLLRGVNVGGRNIVKMAELRAALTANGGESPATYIQSGNIVVSVATTDRADVAALVGSTLADTFDLRPTVLVLTIDELADAIDANSFAGYDAEPQSIHLFFSTVDIVDAEVDDLRPHAVGSEEIAAIGRVVYLYAPDGIGRSKLAARIDNGISSPVTARNLRSAIAIRDLATT